MRRSRGTIFLVLAYLTALVAPLRGGWACPDGTPCVVSRPQRFTCAGSQCANAKSCCVKQEPTTCRHGVLPETHSGDHGAQIQSPDHCRYSVTEPPQLIAMVGQASAVVDPGDAVPVTPLFHGAGVPQSSLRFSALTLGYRPPPLLDGGPSRAPPAG